MCDVICANDHCLHNDHEDGCKLNKIEIGYMGLCLDCEERAGDKSETL